jgi:hypothetical protein
MTVIIALAWMGMAVFKRIKYPIVVFAIAGAGYAVTFILMAVVIQLIYPGAGGEEAVLVPIFLTAALVSSLVMNAIWGASLGWVSQVAINLSKRS